MPNQCSDEGPGQHDPSRRERSPTRGSSVAIKGAKSATKTNRATRTKPMIAPGLRRSREKASDGCLELDFPGLDLRDRHQLSRIRGLRRAYEMSTIRLTRTKTSAMKRIPPCRTG